MTTLPAELAPRFWEESGITPRQLDAGKVRDLGTRLCAFMVHIEQEQTEAQIHPIQPEVPAEILQDQTPELLVAS